MFELTPREIEVAELVAHGYNRSEICKKLHIASTTIITHLSNIYSKCNCHSMHGLAVLWLNKKIKKEYIKKTDIAQFLEQLKQINNAKEIHQEINFALKKLEV